MTATFMTLDREGRTTLPDEVRSALGLEEGDLVLLERTSRGTYELVPAALVPKDQLWFYHPEMQARIAQAEESFSQTSTSADDVQAFLDGLKTA